jgi:hypothetical protein
VDRALDQAAEAYPPAALSWSLEGVVGSVAAIRATCRSRTVTTGTGKNRRTETRYDCSLDGESAARSAMRAWLARFVRVYGALPGHRALLAGWTLDGRWDPAEDGLD